MGAEEEKEFKKIARLKKEAAKDGKCWICLEKHEEILKKGGDGIVVQKLKELKEKTNKGFVINVCPTCDNA